jgi:hypothetical protein
VKLSYDGQVYVTPAALIKTACKLNVENFPFDEKICKMTWGSWAYPKSIISLKNTQPTVDLGSYIGINVKFIKIIYYLLIIIKL